MLVAKTVELEPQEACLPHKLRGDRIVDWTFYDKTVLDKAAHISCALQWLLLCHGGRMVRHT